MYDEVFMAAPLPTAPPHVSDSVDDHRATRGRCRRCGDIVMACRDSNEQVVAVHSVPVRGGNLIINPDTGRIVTVLSVREASASGRRGDSGFVVHDQVCRPGGNRGEQRL